MGIFSVLAVLVAVAVAGATISAYLQRQPSLEVVVDMPPPATEQVVEREAEPASGASPEQAAEAGEREAETAGIEDTVGEMGDEVTQGPAVALAEDVPDIDTAAGSDDDAANPPPNPIAESIDARTEDPEEVALPGEASNKADGGDVETVADPPPPNDLDNVAAAVVEPVIEETGPSVTSTYDGPTPLFGAVVISRRSNLRSEPGPDSPVLAKLDPGERVFRLDDNPVLGYYRVSSNGIVGWIWWLNVRDGPGGSIQG